MTNTSPHYDYEFTVKNIRFIGRISVFETNRKQGMPKALITTWFMAQDLQRPYKPILDVIFNNRGQGYKKIFKISLGRGSDLIITRKGNPLTRLLMLHCKSFGYELSSEQLNTHIEPILMQIRNDHDLVPSYSTY